MHVEQAFYSLETVELDRISSTLWSDAYQAKVRIALNIQGRGSLYLQTPFRHAGLKHQEPASSWITILFHLDMCLSEDVLTVLMLSSEMNRRWEDTKIRGIQCKSAWGRRKKIQCCIASVPTGATPVVPCPVLASSFLETKHTQNQRRSTMNVVREEKKSQRWKLSWYG